MLEIRYYVSSDGLQPFADWFEDLEPNVRARVASSITRMTQGNLAQAKSVGRGVIELQRDIDAAHAYWQDYKGRKR